ncbi:uroporphyrinogen decarboxylase/cobalamine-independent methonine synthase family protein [Nostocoides australiense]
MISAFQVNQYHPSHEAYVADLAEAMRHEYETIVAEGLTLQLDCPDLAMARHTGFQDLSDEEFLAVAEANVEALNAATSNIRPEKMRMHCAGATTRGRTTATYRWSELIAQRIERFDSIVGSERVIASTDCGFGTFAGYGKLDPGVTLKKLQALRAGADLAGARL